MNNTSTHLKSAINKNPGTRDHMAGSENQDKNLIKETGFPSSTQSSQFQPAMRPLPKAQYQEFPGTGYYGQNSQYFNPLRRDSNKLASFPVEIFDQKGTFQASPWSEMLQTNKLGRGRARPKAEFVRSIKLFFKPLNKKTTKDAVLNQLSLLGSINFLRVPYSQKKKKNLGYGLVVFESKLLSLRLARNELDVEIDGRQVAFERFDLQKFKSKATDKNNVNEAPLEHATEKFSKPKKYKNDSCIPTQSASPPDDHFLKPTSTGYHRRTEIRSIVINPGNMRINVLSEAPVQHM